MGNDAMNKKYSINEWKEFEELVPDAFHAFIHFEQNVFGPGVLSVRMKELIAAAVAHTIGCSYSINKHIKNAIENGITKAELSESIMIASILKGGAAIAHGVNALNAFDGEGSDELYKRTYFKRFSEFSSTSNGGFRAYISFVKQTMKPGALTVKEKELIAIAVSHTTACVYCIDIHTKGAKKEEATIEELTESILIATALQAASTIAYGVKALNAYD